MNKKGVGIGIVLVILVVVAVFFLIPKNQTVTIGLTGDVMLGRVVNDAIAQAGYEYPWGDVLPILRENDLNLINLETTLTTSEERVEKKFNFKADPQVVESLKLANISVVTLANNHALDFYEEGLVETLTTLDDAGIAHVGAGMNLEEATEPVIIERNGIRVGILGWTNNSSEWAAEEDVLGTNYIKVGDTETISAQISILRPQVDVLVVTAHWGPNWREEPNEQFQTFAHQIIDAGADIFHGHSAHVTQGIEIYQGKPILYDTGDFIDDYAHKHVPRIDLSFLYIIEANKTGPQNIRLLPVLISNNQVNLATGTEYQQMLDRIKQISEPFGTILNQEEKGIFINWN